MTELGTPKLYRFSNGARSWEYTFPGLRPEEAGYIAGLIDGEGSICVKKCHQWYQAVISIGNTDRRCLDYVASKLQVGNVKHWQPAKPDRRPIRSNKPMFSWYIGSRAAVHGIIVALRPFLIIKSEQADAVMEMLGRVEEIPVEVGFV